MNACDVLFARYVPGLGGFDALKMFNPATVEQRNAVRDMVMLGRCGSQLYGTNLDDTDHDYMGMFAETAESVFGKYVHDTWTVHTAGEGNRSAAGDVDLAAYSVRKWVRLASEGNPTVLTLMFTPPRHALIKHAALIEPVFEPGLYRTAQAGKKFRGYLKSQRDQMLGIVGRRHTNRPELVDAHGYDTKFAYHAVRLGMQGVEFLGTGKITLPMRVDQRQRCLAIRRGEIAFDEVVQEIDYWDDLLGRQILSGDLPPTADHDDIARRVADLHLEWWGYFSET